MAIRSDFSRRLLPTLTALAASAMLAGCSKASESAAPGAGAGAGNADRAAMEIAASRQSDGATVASSAPAAKTPCAYMARADAEVALGQSLPNTSETAALGMCDYNTPEFYGASLTIGDWTSIRNAATSGPHPPVAIEGLGDEALNLNGSNGSNLYVRKGDRGFLLILNGPAIDHLADHGLEREKALALKILPDL